MRLKPYLLAFALTVPGCAVPAHLQGATLILKPTISAGDYTTKTELPAYTQSSIHHLVLNLYTVNAGEHDLGISKTLSNADLNKVVTFSNLRVNTTYRIKATAYADPAGTVIISTSDANSYTDVTITNNDSPTVGPLKVKLINRDFNGQGTSSIAITNGGYIDPGTAQFQTIDNIVTTLAGSGATGSIDGQGTAASFQRPFDVAVDANKNVYVADTSNHLIRKISPSGLVTTLAGNGNSTFADGQGTAASFKYPNGVAVDAYNNVYVADLGNQRIRKISPAGLVTTLAGNGISTFADGQGTAASFNSPYRIAIDSDNTIYVGDEANQRIRKVSPTGLVTTLAGSGNAAYADGQGTAASFKNPSGVAVDADRNVYVVDCGNYRIRKITPSGMVTTFAGSGNAAFADGQGTEASFNWQRGIAIDSQQNLYIADEGNFRVRKISPSGLVTSIAGSGDRSSSNGIGTNATFMNIVGIAVDSDKSLYIADYIDHKIRKVNQ